MLVAVNCGRSQSPSLVLSRRRSMRRLRLASLRCKVAFTRNPSGLRVLETPDPLSNPRKAERFRVFHGISSPTNGGFALLRPSKGLLVNFTTADLADPMTRIANIGMFAPVGKSEKK